MINNRVDYMENIIHINPRKPEPHLIRQAAKVLIEGGIIGYPTETVYGIGCNALDAAAVDRIYDLKGRDRSKAMIVIAGDILQVRELVKDIPPAAEKLIDNFWPGPLTIIFDAVEKVAAVFRSGHNTIAVRIPDSRICLSLIRQTGFPLISTSANPSGEPPATTAEEVAAAFGNQLDLIIDGGPTPSRTPSTVVDVTRTPVRIVRQGAVSALEIRTVLDTI